MFGSIGLPEVLFILVLGLLIFGPKRLPEVGRTLGKGLREFRKATSDLKRSVEIEMSQIDEPAPRPAPVPEPAVAAAASGDAEAGPDPDRGQESPPEAEAVEAGGSETDGERASGTGPAAGGASE